MDIPAHLKERRMETWRYHWSHDEDTACFYLFNLSGQIVGYQQYRPFADKECRNDPKSGRYYTYVKDKKLAVWGLESYKYRGDILCITEGIFDACQLHRFQIPAIAVLSNDPKPLIPWLCSIPRLKIGFPDGDQAGLRLKRVCDYTNATPDGHDLGDTDDTKIQAMLEGLGL